MSDISRSGQEPPDTEHLLALAEWAVEQLHNSTDYAQAFVEHTLEIRVECLDGEVLATNLDPHEGLGCLVRQGTAWRYRHMPLSRLEQLSQWLNPRHEAPLLAPEWHSGWQPPDFVPVAAAEWLIPNAGAEHSLRSIENMTTRAFAVADTTGVRATSARWMNRRRVEATVTIDGCRYRGLSRSLCRESDASHPDTVSLARTALRNALDATAAAVTGYHRTPVVFGPAAAAGFLHELVGHALEGDNFALNSDYIAQLRMSKRLPTSLTLVDDPLLPHGYGSYDVNDEGDAARPTTLLANGELGAPLTSVSTIHRYGYRSAGNGRRANYQHVALPRASNTVALPGFEDSAHLLQSKAPGVLHVGGLGAGMINLTTGEFSFAGLNCSLVTASGDRLPTRDVSLFGDALDTLMRLEAIGSDFGGDNVTCGKQGQMLPIGLFSPSIRYSALDWSAA